MLNNSAKIGGAIYFNTRYPGKREINIFDSVFENNIAIIEGGAISHTTSNTNFINLTLKGNYATIYGNDFSCIPIGMGILLPSKDQNLFKGGIE